MKLKDYKFFILTIFLFLFFGSLMYGYIYCKQISHYVFLLGGSGFISSLFYGWKAVIIFGYPDKQQKLPEYSNSWWVHQFWFNFAGSLVGWFFIILFVYIFTQSGIERITLIPLIIFLFGILGVVGLIPSLLAQIPNVLHLLTKKYGEDYLKK